MLEVKEAKSVLAMVLNSKNNELAIPNLFQGTYLEKKKKKNVYQGIKHCVVLYAPSILIN